MLAADWRAGRGRRGKILKYFKEFFLSFFQQKTKRIRNIRFNAMTISEFPESWSNVDKSNIREGKWKDKNRYHRCSFGRPGPFWLASEWCIHDIPPVSWHDWRPPKVTGPWRHKMSSTQTIAQLNSISLFNSIEKILPVNRYDNDERLELVDLEIEICISNV